MKKKKNSDTDHQQFLLTLHLERTSRMAEDTEDSAPEDANAKICTTVVRNFQQFSLLFNSYKDTVTQSKLFFFEKRGILAWKAQLWRMSLKISIYFHYLQSAMKNFSILTNETFIVFLAVTTQRNSNLQWLLFAEKNQIVYRNLPLYRHLHSILILK